MKLECEVYYGLLQKLQQRNNEVPSLFSVGVSSLCITAFNGIYRFTLSSDDNGWAMVDAVMGIPNWVFKNRKTSIAYDFSLPYIDLSQLKYSFYICSCPAIKIDSFLDFVKNSNLENGHCEYKNAKDGMCTLTEVKLPTKQIIFSNAPLMNTTTNYYSHLLQTLQGLELNSWALEATQHCMSYI